MTRPGVYKHFKGGMYRVLFTAVNANNRADYDGFMVVYMPLYGNGAITCRSEREFNGLVTMGELRVARFVYQHS